ncbi:DUF305 domain-containing protein [Amycolatopsis albispora]|uniref:DUF305 domain-containing protein n=1 Tax=Amycolatopsis albispora TaxID=1804986 RepID=A0A344LA45_9PSEU|nr:DUF305 domain-containing protein [Amycolatopsis albispora]AXB44919.1 DUF305 domain-containing protein [Amycolatopsis albispora]
MSSDRPDEERAELGEPGVVDVDTDAPEPRPAWSRVVILGAATLAVLLVGATIGMFLSQSLGQDTDSANPAPGPVEVGFAQDMAVHHLQAVTMANWARDHSTDPQVQQLAFDIASTQLEQVGRMKGWLMLWNKPEQAIGGYMTWMTESAGHGHGGHAAATGQAAPGEPPMPGMATNDELAKLRSLSGKELDVYFLQLMLRHHQGGTEMAQYTQDHTGMSAVKSLTNSILKSQGAEVRVMTGMLADRGATPLPFS